MTLIEVLVVIAMLAVLAAVFLPTISAPKYKASRINCVSNLMQIGLALKVWEGDNGDKFPMAFAATNDAEMKSLQSGNVYSLFQTISNELSTPKILHCPADGDYFWATNFETLGDTNISYFLNLDASDVYPNMILSGDDNLLVNGKPVQSGISTLRKTDSLAWQNNRHNRVGNIGMADGSVQQVTIQGLQNAFTNSFADTNSPSINRFVIP